MGSYLMGLDIGSSFVKVSLLDLATGRVIGSESSPQEELKIESPKPGFAEQDPEVWWKHVLLSVEKLRSKGINLGLVEAIGISYQMHGLVLVDKTYKVLRPAIIWCDSRAVKIGEKAFEEIGKRVCLERYLNSPGNFTASKLRWVKENEPEVYSKIYKAMLPGDYIAMRLTGEICTTPSGLSEGIFWDFKNENKAAEVLDYFGIESELLPKIARTFSIQGRVTREMASLLHLTPGIPVSYRAGDQPNNAFSLNVLEPGEVAATAGTSGVIYGVSSTIKPDEKSRVNTFLHVNHELTKPRYGTLLCVNGTGILNSWIRRLCSAGEGSLTYERMNHEAIRVPPGADGLFVFPYGNGAERSLENKNIGASVRGLSFTSHTPSHVFRAVQEGIVFALTYGFEIMRGMGIEVAKIRAGKSNMFLSRLFVESLSCCTGAQIELYRTDGAQGAARGAGLGAGKFSSTKEAFQGLVVEEVVDSESNRSALYRQIYHSWREILASYLGE